MNNHALSILVNRWSHVKCRSEFYMQFQLKSDSPKRIKSVNSDFTLAVHSQKTGQHSLLSHHNLCHINRFATFPTRDQWLARSTSDLLIVGLNPGLAIFFLFFFTQMRQKLSLGLIKFWWVYCQSKVRINWLEVSTYLFYGFIDIAA